MEVKTLQITLKAARINCGITQDEVGKALNVGRATIGNWESGKTSPRADQMLALCVLYGVPVDGVIMPKMQS